jgi:hypothetical protein
LLVCNNYFSVYVLAEKKIALVINLQIPSKIEGFLTSCATTSFSRRTLLHGIGYLALSSELLKYLQVQFH